MEIEGDIPKRTTSNSEKTTSMASLRETKGAFSITKEGEATKTISLGTGTTRHSKEEMTDSSEREMTNLEEAGTPGQTTIEKKSDSTMVAHYLGMKEVMEHQKMEKSQPQ